MNTLANELRKIRPDELPIRKIGSPLENHEALSSDGNSITCKRCGKTRAVKAYSKIYRISYWNPVLEDGYGCDCDRKAAYERYHREYATKIKEVYTQEKYMGVSKGYLKDSSFYGDFFKTLPERIKAPARDVLSYCKNFSTERTTGLYVYSDKAGLCKTSMMACARNFLLDKGIPCILTNVAEISDAYRDDRELFWSYVNVVVLIIDDIGIQDPSKTKAAYMGLICDAMYELLNARMLRKTDPTLFTSNFTINELQNKRGFTMQIADRIRGMVMDNIIEVKGESIRGTE